MSGDQPTNTNVAVVLNRDLLFGSRVRGALKTLDLEARFVETAEAFVEVLRDTPESIAIGIIDMNGAVTWEVIGAALGSQDASIPVIAFGSHKDVENFRAAKASGVTRVVANSQFHKEMGALIERYRRH